jgi:hypothetical protein
MPELNACTNRYGSGQSGDEDDKELKMLRKRGHKVGPQSAPL